MKIQFIHFLFFVISGGLLLFASCETEEDCLKVIWYQDLDNDGLGNPDITQTACLQPSGYVDNKLDDDDACPGMIDECGVCDGPGLSIWYQDADGDGLGNPDISQVACEQPDGYVDNGDDDQDSPELYPAVSTRFEGRIDLTSLENYANQSVPSYITKDNSGANHITDAGATLGRVLFYDKNLSSNQTVSCATCHKQSMAFSDDLVVSRGVNGLTGRHSMRLINAGFANEVKFFWDERATSLEDQSTQPIKDHAEMGFSGADGDPGFEDLLASLDTIGYYGELFTFAYGDREITERRIQDAIAQFVRSIQSFDTKFDEGRGQVNNNNMPFPNFSAEENMGKNLFILPPIFNPNGVRIGGGAGCQGCHNAPEFDIDPNTRNNGIIGVADMPGEIDISVSRAPSLRNLIRPDGQANGPFMHDASLHSLESVMEHYNSITAVPANTNLDNRLRPMGNPQQLQLSEQEKQALLAFLATLTGTEVYTASKWSDPFQP